MSVLLAIETSTSQGSVALLETTQPASPRILFSEDFAAGRSHSSQLFAVLERALDAVPEGDDLHEISVGLGPGSYAGVRIAISAATGLALARDARLTGLPSIVALDEGDYIAIGDARRETFYFAVVRGGECVAGPSLVSAADLPGRIDAAGGLPIFAAELSPSFEGLGLAASVELRHPCAQRLARLAVAGKAVIARDLLEPIYLRDPHITQPKA